MTWVFGWHPWPASIKSSRAPFVLCLALHCPLHTSQWRFLFSFSLQDDSVHLRNAQPSSVQRPASSIQAQVWRTISKAQGSVAEDFMYWHQRGGKEGNNCAEAAERSKQGVRMEMSTHCCCYEAMKAAYDRSPSLVIFSLSPHSSTIRFLYLVSTSQD